MPIKIEITGATTAEALAEMYNILSAHMAVQQSQPPEETAVKMSEPSVKEVPKSQPEEAPAKDEKPKTRGRKKKAEKEEPELPLENDAAQDEEDEAAEDASQEQDTVTIDDLRKIALTYVHKYGVPAANADGIAICEQFGKRQIKDFADADQETLRDVYEAFVDLVENNPNNREEIGAD